jgi:beta-mannosidase
LTSESLKRVNIILSLNQQEIQREIELIDGNNEISMDFTPENVKLWFPFGYGDQILYDFHLRVLNLNSNLIASSKKRIAFRKVELVQDKIDNDNNYEFYFKVNDIPIFAKGANFIPMDSFERQSTQTIDRLIQNAVDANMNMLRVWGGGIYQSNEFYEKCDEKGILIWQEFMFACSMYPRHSEFLE